MPNTLEIVEKGPELLITAGMRSACVPANLRAVTAARRSGSVTRMLEPAPEPVMDSQGFGVTERSHLV
jgi:hypothetical protein